MRQECLVGKGEQKRKGEQKDEVQGTVNSTHFSGSAHRDSGADVAFPLSNTDGFDSWTRENKQRE